jgi:hypothetical protein
MKPGRAPLPRGDYVDVLLVWWLVLLRLSGLESMPSTLSLGALFVVLLYRRIFAPRSCREVHLLGVTLLSIASASTAAVSSGMTPLLKGVVTHVFFLAAWFAANELLRQPFGARLLRDWRAKETASSADESLSRLYEQPGLAALLTFGAGVGLQSVWELCPAWVLFSPWVVPFWLNLVYLRRIPPQVVHVSLRSEEAWPRPFGSAAWILSGLAAVSLHGFAWEFHFGESPSAWFVLAVILLLHTLAILKLQQWASEARLTAPGVAGER